MPHLPAQPVDQIGYVVDNLDAAVRFWEESAGVGPWMVFRDVVLQGTLWEDGKEKALEVGMDVALSASGTTEIELIAPRGSGLSPYLRDGAPEVGAHHVAFIIEDYAAAKAAALAAGLTLLFEGRNEAVTVCYLQNPAMPGTRFELIAGEGQRALLDQLIRDARAWKGPTSPT